MKVCFIGHGNLPVLAKEYNKHGIGGEQVQQTLIARALSKRGYQITMVTSDYGQNDGDNWHGIQVFKAFRPTAGLPIIRFLYPRLTGLWSALKRANADVYYTSCAGIDVGIAAIFCKFYKKGLVFRLASDTDADPQRLLIRYTRDKKLYEFGLRRAHSVLSQHALQQQMLYDNYHVQSNIANMLVEPPNRDLSLIERDIPILWVSNLRNLKRPDLALALSRRLQNHHLHMVGGPQPGFADLFHAIMREATAIPNMTFHGLIPYHEVGDYYDRARVFVNTSDIEGFPNTYLQCWRRGIPVVAFFDPDGIIKRERLGVTVSSIEEMSTAVQILLNDDQEWNAASLRCRRYMEKYFGDDDVLKPYISAIEAAYQDR